MEDTTGTTQRKLPDAGTQPARCFAIVDIGKQKQSFGGVEKEPANEIMIFWELTKFMHQWKEGEEKQPLFLSQRYTWSDRDKAKLPKVLKSWGNLPKPIEKLTVKLVSMYVGKPCMLSIEHNTKKDTTYANISGNGLGVSQFMKELPLPTPFFKDIFFNLKDFTWDAFNALPPYAQKSIRASLDWPAIIKQHPEKVNNQSTSTSSQPDQNDIVQNDDETPSF